MTTETNTERLTELIKRQPSRWGNLTKKEFERDVELLQEQAERAQALEQQYNNLIQATKKALQVTAYPKSSQKIFIRQCFEDFWDPELVSKLKELDGEQT